MYSLYRRHEQDCRFQKKGIRHTQCNCPIWMDGSDENNKRQRRSLRTRDWRYAQQKLDRIAHGIPLPAPKPASRPLESAVAEYLADAKLRQLAPATLYSYTKLLGHLTKALPGATIADVDADALSRFRQAREVTSATHVKELGFLRAFFHFCVARKWIPANPASALRPPKHDPVPTLPFTPEELTKLLDASDRIDNQNPREIARARLRARALVLLLVYSGLRISDAVKLKRTSVEASGRMLVRMMKTRRPLYITLPALVLEALARLPHESEYFFWSGTAKLSTAVGSARRTIDSLAKRAGVENGHPHRFRDTFAVTLLEAGEDLRTVQQLLGHTSIRTTEKHYAPWVQSMQRRLDDAVAKLTFGLPGQSLMDAGDNAGGNTKRNLLSFPAAPPRKSRRA